MKKIISILLVLILSLTMVTPVFADSIILDFGDVAGEPGDVDVDTLVTSADLIVLRKILLGTIEAQSKKTADVNENGEVNIIDLVRLKKNLVNYTKYPAYLENPMSSIYDFQANVLRNDILSIEDELPESVTGTIWYISPDGKSSNSGKSADSAWDSLATYNEKRGRINAGDAVLFERGGVYRGSFFVRDGVYYGAYGSGEKPVINGSAMDYANATWTEESANLWVCAESISKDAGIVVFNEGSFMGYKKPEKSQLSQNGDFWYDSTNQKIYMYMEKNPASAYKSIEIGTNDMLVTITGKNNVTIENLCLKYTGGHGIYIEKDSSNVTIRGCEIGFIGGSYLSGTTRYGNGIEIWKAATNVLMEYNWVYQIYDSGLTTQGAGEYIVKDITMRKNLIEYCGMGSFEYFLAGAWEVCRGENVIFADNICRFAGYNWAGEQRPDKVSKHIRSDYSCPNAIFNFQIKNNIFDQSAVDLIGIGGTAVTLTDIPQNPAPVMSGNRYAQNANGGFGTYFQRTNVVFDNYIDYFIENNLGDTKAGIYKY